MVMVLPNAQRGLRDYGWLKSYHSFSFGNYYNPNFIGYKNLRVINEDFVTPKAGFPTHEHANMEILTYMISGQLTHEDTLGHKCVIDAGDIQYIRAGHGISHSEFNASETDIAHFLQIWLLPHRRDIEPTYEQTTLPSQALNNKLTLIAAGSQNSDNRPVQKIISLNSDAKIYASLLELNHEITHTPDMHQDIWIQVITGKLRVNGHVIDEGGAIAFDSEQQVSIHAIKTSHFLLFDLGSVGMV